MSQTDSELMDWLYDSSRAHGDTRTDENAWYEKGKQLIAAHDKTLKQKLLAALPEMEDMDYWKKKYYGAGLAWSDLEKYDQKNDTLSDVTQAIKEVFDE